MVHRGDLRSVVCSNTPPQLLTEVHAGVDAKGDIEMTVVAVELEVVVSGLWVMGVVCLWMVLPR